MRTTLLSKSSSSPTSNVINIISISDIHLGHPRTETAHMIHGLRTGLMTDKIFADLDLLIFAGDVFDRDLRLPQYEVSLIHDWIVDLIRLCTLHGVILRVLEGTPSHDWRQSKMFMEINALLGNACDVAHVCDLQVEHLEKFDLSVLYIPDEYSETCHETQAKVSDLLLSTLGVEAIDIIVMHGSFNYQYPKFQQGKIDCHNDQYYDSITRYFVTVGHVHRRGNWGKIWSQGSWDCIAHGEPDPKGGIYVKLTLGKPEKTKVSWLVNHNAKVYKTVNLENVDPDMAVAVVHDHAVKLPAGSNIRVVAQKDHPVLGTIQQLRIQYPQLVWSSKRVDSESEKAKLLTLPSAAKRMYRQINHDNIRETIRSRLGELSNIDLTMEILEELLNE